MEQIKIMNKITGAGDKLRPVTATELLMGWYAMVNTYPELKLSDVLTPLGIQYITQTSQTQCSHHMSDTLVYFEQYTGDVFLKERKNQQAWTKRYLENSLGTIPVTIPLAVYQGADDLAVFPEATTLYVKQACNIGAKISYKIYPKVDHIGLSMEAKTDFLKWISDRLARTEPPVTCAKAK